MPRLIAMSGPLIGRRFEVQDSLVIGCAADGSAVVPAGEGSVRAAALWAAGGELKVADLASGRGTWVDGAPISQPCVLPDGAQLQVGSTSFIVEVDAWASGPAGSGGSQDPAKPIAIDRDRTQAVLMAIPRDATPPAPVSVAALGPPPPPPPPLAARPVPAPAPWTGPAHPQRRRADSRMWLPAVATFVTIIATAVALVVYFGVRG